MIKKLKNGKIIGLKKTYNYENMSISDILQDNLTKETRGRVSKLAQYFYLTNRISYSCFLYIISKPFY